LDEWRLIDRELDAAEWHTALVDKAAGVVENTTADGWPNGEEGWRTAALERGGERGQRRSGAVESTAAAWSRWSMLVVVRTRRSYSEWRETDNSRADKVGISEDASGELGCVVTYQRASGRMDILSTALPTQSDYSFGQHLYINKTI
jgi:hypothetical protein